MEARGRGDLNIEDMAGTVNVTDSRGDVRLNNIGKDVRVEASRGGLVRAAGVKGTVDLQGRGGDVQLEDIAGQVTINGEFSGTLEFRKLAKPLHFESSHSDFRAEQVPGSITMDLGSMKLDNVVGPVKFRTGNSRHRCHGCVEFVGAECGSRRYSGFRVEITAAEDGFTFAQWRHYIDAAG